MGDAHPSIHEEHDHYHNSGGSGGCGGGYGGGGWGGLGGGLIGGALAGLLFGRGGFGHGGGHGGGGKEWAEDARWQGLRDELHCIKSGQREAAVTREIEEVDSHVGKVAERQCAIEKEILLMNAANTLAMCKLENGINEKFCLTNRNIDSVRSDVDKQFAAAELKAKDAAIFGLRERIEKMEGAGALERLRTQILCSLKGTACTACDTAMGSYSAATA